MKLLLMSWLRLGVWLNLSLCVAVNAMNLDRDYLDKYYFDRYEESSGCDGSGEESNEESGEEFGNDRMGSCRLVRAGRKTEKTLRKRLSYEALERRQNRDMKLFNAIVRGLKDSRKQESKSPSSDATQDAFDFRKKKISFSDDGDKGVTTKSLSGHEEKNTNAATQSKRSQSLKSKRKAASFRRKMRGLEEKRKKAVEESMANGDCILS